MLFYVIAEVGNYLENRIDPIAIIVNDDYVIRINGQMFQIFGRNF